jgi:hypothetical protein
VGFARWFRGIEVDKCYALGQWDEAVTRADAFIAEIDAGSPHYLAPQVYLSRALIALARDRDAAVRDDAARALEGARRAKDPQIVYLTLAGAAHVHSVLGDSRTADALADEFLAALASGRAIGFSVAWLHVLAWSLTETGRGRELVAALPDDEHFPWVRAAIAFAEEDPIRAADICDRMGAVTEEAYARLSAARVLARTGRRAEADAQLRPALAFYRAVGAARYVREGEALLAASA